MQKLEPISRNLWLITLLCLATLCFIAARLGLPDASRLSVLAVGLPAKGSEVKSDALYAPPQEPSTSVLGKSEGREGAFEVFTSRSRSPIVRIENGSEYPLRLVLYDSNGKTKTLDANPFSDASMEVPLGQFSAEVLDVSGTIPNITGSATFKEFKEYRAGFVVGSAFDQGTFHIGD